MSKKLPKFITQRQALAMFDTINQKCATGARNHAILVTLFKAGLRNSEVCNLTLPDVDFENEMIYVQNGKGEKDRYIPMDSDVMQTCKNWLQFRPESQFFFCTMKGGILDTRYIREMCYRISKKAGVYIQDGKEKKKVWPHALRHSCFTSLLKEDFNVREIQQLAGHSSLNTTMVYTHVVLDDLKQKFKDRESIVR